MKAEQKQSRSYLVLKVIRRSGKPTSFDVFIETFEHQSIWLVLILDILPHKIFDSNFKNILKVLSR